MRVHVIVERCQGHNRCVAVAPALFKLDEYGNASPTAPDVPVGEEANALLAAASCPEQAIEVVETVKEHR